MLRHSPLLEIYKKKGIEVLILDDDIDEIVFSMVRKYCDIDLKAVSKSNDDFKDGTTPVLGDAVKEVPASPTAHR